jgi:hypothetical protein
MTMLNSDILLFLLDLLYLYLNEILKIVTKKVPYGHQKELRNIFPCHLAS